VLPGTSRARKVLTDSVPPKEADVVVIGGGIIGVTTAYNLAQQGVSVALCEKGAIAGEASGRAYGVITTSGLDPAKFEILELSKRLWSGMNSAVGDETGYRQNGYLSVFTTEKARGFWEEWLQRAGPTASRARVLTADEANAQLPAATRWLGAFQEPTDGCVEPALASSVIAAAAIQHGARIVAPCAVRGFETAAGRVSHVVTEKGVIRTSSVVLAGGCWSTLFAEHAGLDLPSLNIFASLVRVRQVDAPAPTLALPGLSLRKQIDGGWTLGTTSGRIAITPALLQHLWAFRKMIAHPLWDVRPNLSSYFWREWRANTRWKLDEVTPFEETRVLEPEVNTKLTDQWVQRARAELRGFDAAQIVERWSGALNVTPDNMPVISAVKQIPGLYLATGFSYGVMMGPAAGLLISELVTGKTPSVDLHRYRHSRFTDGSILEPTE
jgi:glycine/D-amino acid oxidase-like deaminating enzyme